MTDPVQTNDDLRHYTLTPVEAKNLPYRILAELLRARTEKRRLTGKQLAKMFGYRDDRKIRIAIAKLIGKGHLIVSSVHKNKGYYFAETQADVDAYVRTEFSRISKDYARVRQIQRNAERSMGPQLPLRLEEK